MKMPVFIASQPWLIIGCMAVALGLAAGGRFLFMDGGSWTILTVVATTVIFTLAAADSAHLLDYQVAPGRWLGSAVVCAVVAAAVAAGVLGVAMFVMQDDSPYYSGYDSFIVTSGPVEWLDTNGQPYIVPDAGVGGREVVLTLLVVFTIFLAAALVGVGLGAVRARRSARAQWVVVFAGIAVAIAVAWFIDQVLGISVPAPLPGVFLFCIPVAVVGVVAAGVSIQRSRTRWAGSADRVKLARS
ncbi:MULTISPECIES: hypothetical protein [unclassified Corynebacterium]|uniref:hypothetical protein n=1 Tax=unclassified Corynebacterium TaxID=2624378 RepID=UPI0034CF3A36